MRTCTSTWVCVAARFNAEGRASQVRLPEGPACRVRCATLDHPFPFARARQACPSDLFRRDLLVRSVVQRWIIHCALLGHDKRAPPTFSGGTCLSGPSCNVGSSIPFCSGTTSVPLRGCTDAVEGVPPISANSNKRKSHVRYGTP